MKFQRQVLSLFAIFMLTLCLYDVRGEKSEGNEPPYRDVVVIGGGLAGMAAARHLQQDLRINVKVLEAKQERYGGRIWTMRGKTKGLKGVERELGGLLLNTKAYDGAFAKLLKKLEIEVKSPGSVEIYFPERDGDRKVLSGQKAQELYTELFTIIVKAVQEVKASGVDRPLSDVVNEALENYKELTDEDKFDKEMLLDLLNTLPSPLCQNFSTLLYDIQSEFGWDNIVVDGLDTLVDRIVGGDGMERPVKVDLKKVVRNIKIDDNRQKVLVRTTDRKQLIVDAVVLAVPIGVLKSRSIIIEPSMPKEWYQAINDIGIGFSSKVIVGFDKAFWPKDPGAFTVSSKLATNGFLQMWTNAYKFSGNPYLIGNIFGDKAKEWETAKKSDLKKKVIAILGEMFGAENVEAHNMTVFYTSKWSTDELTLGSVSYAQVGNTEALWETLRKPACPYLFFAGAHTESLGHVDSLHGAYMSGIKAANQILSNACEKVPEKQEKKTDTSKEKKTSTTKSEAKKKDEL